MKRVALFTISLQPPGGGNGVGAWTLQALVPDHEVTVVSFEPVDVGPINRYYGTRLESHQFKELTPSRWLRTLVSHSPIRPLASLQLAILLRLLRAVAGRFDVLISTHNEVDFGRRGIQYVHWPWVRHQEMAYVGAVWHRGPLRALLRLYRWGCQQLAPFTIEGVRRNVTVVNSSYIADLFESLHHSRPLVIHPPAAGDFPVSDWRSRADEFVCIGRVASEKELPKIMRVIDAVRSRGHNVRLHVVGSTDPGHAAEYREVMSMIAAREHVTFHDSIPRSAMIELLARCRYGIHGMIGEHFGMAVAEMVRAGCIVFVPDSGGQIDIVGRNPHVLYHDEAEAVSRICEMLSSSQLQHDVGEHLRQHGESLSAERFVDEMRALLATFTAAEPHRVSAL